MDHVLVMPEKFAAGEQLLIDTLADKYAPVVKGSSLYSGKSESYLW